MKPDHTFHAVVVTGEYGAGKTTVAEHLVGAHSFERLSFVERIWKPTLVRRNVERTRTALQALGRELVDSLGIPALVDQLLATRQTSRVVFDDARRIDVVDAIRERIPRVEHVHVDAPFAVRLPRLVARDGVDSRDWHDRIETEQVQTKRAVLDVASIADHRIENTGDLTTLYRGIDSILRTRSLI